MTREELRGFLKERREARLRAYEACPADLSDHFGIEQAMLGGGYGYARCYLGQTSQCLPSRFRDPTRRTAPLAETPQSRRSAIFFHVFVLGM